MWKDFIIVLQFKDNKFLPEDGKFDFV